MHPDSLPRHWRYIKSLILGDIKMGGGY